MVEPLRHPRSATGTNLLLILLICAGLAGNVWSLQLFTGFNYLFGSVAVMLVTSLYGMRWGVLAALIASSWTWHLFGHPYAMIWLTGEALFVGAALKRGKTRNIILYVAMYWPLIGIPLLWFFFLIVMRTPYAGTATATLMYWTIGITNGLIASLLLNYLPVFARSWRAQRDEQHTSIHQLIFHLMMSVVLFPAAIVMVLHGRQIEENFLHELANHLRASSDVALYELRLKLQRNMLVLSRLVSEAEKHQAADRLQLATQLLHESNPDMSSVYVGDAAGRSVTFSPVTGPDDPHIGTDFSDRLYYRQLCNTRKPVITGIFKPRTQNPAPIVAMALPILKGEALTGFAMAGLDLQPLARLIREARYKPFHQVTLTDSQDHIIASTRPDLRVMELYSPQKHAMPPSTDFDAQLVPGGGGERMPLWLRAGRSAYLRHVSLGNEAPWNLIVETPFAPYQHKIFHEHIQALTVLLLVNLLALWAALVTSRRLAGPILRLSQLSTDLPERLLREEVIEWPESQVAEIAMLSSNFRAMATALGHRLQEITRANETLELRVEERTGELKAANQELLGEIAERKRTEQQRDKLMQELAQKNKELEGIIYIASHDLRSPLVNVQGFSRKLAKSCAEVNTLTTSLALPAETDHRLKEIFHEIPRYLHFITGSVERMDALLSGLLRLSRLGRAALCFETLDMRAILEKIVSSMAYQIETAGARIEVGSCQACMADGGQVTQVFSNLLDNAIKYRSPERPLLVTIFSETVSDGVRYCVADNGLGIPSDQQEKIWEIFQRLNPEGTQGEGLGLTIARRIVDRIGGSIHVESEPGQGSRFYVVLPHAPEQCR